MGGDGVEPAREGGCDDAGAAGQFHEAFLGDVLGVMGTTGDPEAGAVDYAGVGADQFGKGVGITRAGIGLQKICVAGHPYSPNKYAYLCLRHGPKVNYTEKGKKWPCRCQKRVKSLGWVEMKVMAWDGI